MNRSHLPTESSGQDDLPLGERRSEARAGLVTSATLVVSGDARACQIQNISPHGIQINAREVPQPGQRVWLEIAGLDERAAAVVIWRSGGSCGLRFEDVQVLRYLLAVHGLPSEVARAPRFSLEMAAAFCQGAATFALDVIDISLCGLKLGVPTPSAPKPVAPRLVIPPLVGGPNLVVGSPGIVRFDGILGDLPGRIRWLCDDIAGFRFDQPIGRNDLYGVLCRN